MTIPPIFKFRNVRVRLSTTDPTFIYGVISNDTLRPNQTLDPGITPDSVSTVILTVQISNISNPSATVNVSAFVDTATIAGVGMTSLSRNLVKSYPLIPNNAFDPLSGNLILSTGDQLWVQADVANSCDVVVSLLEIANATGN